MRAFTAALLAFVLAFAPAAQAQVVGGRAVAVPVGGLGLAPLQPAPRWTAPTLALTPLSAPGLTPSLSAPAPVPIAVMAPAVAAIPATAAPVRALAARPLSAAAAPRRTEDGPAPIVQARFDELKAAFDEKRPESVEGADGAAQPRLAPADAPPLSVANDNEPPAPAAKPHRLGLSRPLAFFLIALVLAQVGIEAQTAVLPPLIAKVFGSVSLAADAGMTASIAELVGTLAAPIAAKTLGLKNAYLWSTGLRIATGGLIAGLLAAGWLSMTGLMALFAVDALLLGVSLITEKSIPAVILNQDQRKLEHFKAARQIAIETAAAIVPIATGALVAACGFIPALFAFPLALGVSVALVSLTLKFPGKVSGLDGNGLPGPGEGSLSTYWRHLKDGVLEVARTPALLFSVLTYSVVYVPVSLIYWLMAPAYALRLAGPGNEALAAGYGGMMLGLYSFGGIVAGLWVMHRQKKERGEAEMRGSMLKWTVAAALGMALLGTMAIPVAPLWGTLTLPALALLVFAVPQVIAKLKLESFFQSRAPKGKVDDATAVLESASSIVIALGLWWFGKLLAGAGIASLGSLALAIGPLIGALLLLTWALARASRP